MNYLDRLYGNAAIKQTLLGSVSSGKLAHAYIIEGDEGSGRKTLVHLLAAEFEQKLHGSSGNGDINDICEKILNGYCPDVIYVSKTEGKKLFGVDNVRAFIKSAALTPNELDFKFYIFNNADDMTVQAQNALLKIIEEPPAGTHIFLLCEKSSSLLPTVRSRAQKLTMQRFGDDEITEYLKSNIKDAVSDGEKLTFAIKLSNGSPGKAAAFYNGCEDEFEAYKKVKRVISIQSKKHADATESAFLSEICGFADTREKLGVLTALLLKAYGDITESLYGESADTAFFTENEVNDLAKYFNTDVLMKSTETASKIKCELSSNINPGLGAVMLAASLWDAAE